MDTETSASISKREVGDSVIVTVIVAIMGAAIVAAFWGIWYLVTGSIPKIFGVSRFWIDVAGGALYAIILAIYVVSVMDEYYKLYDDDCEDYYLSFWEIVSAYSRLCLFGVLLIVSLIVSIFLTLAAGLTLIVVLVGIGATWNLFLKMKTRFKRRAGFILWQDTI